MKIVEGACVSIHANNRLFFCVCFTTASIESVACVHVCVNILWQSYICRWWPKWLHVSGSRWEVRSHVLHVVDGRTVAEVVALYNSRQLPWQPVCFRWRICYSNCRHGLQVSGIGAWSCIVPLSGRIFGSNNNNNNKSHSEKKLARLLLASRQRTMIVNNKFRASHSVYNSWQYRRQDYGLVIVLQQLWSDTELNRL